MRSGPGATFIAAILAMSAVAIAPAAQAQPTATTAKADALFNEGRALLDAGKFKEACAKFEASLAEADALGTRLNLALCMEKRGRIYTAVVKFDDTAARADRAGQADSARVARQHADALRPRIPVLELTLADPVPGQHVVLRRAGDPDRQIDARRPVPVDPTDPNDPTDVYHVVAEADGHAAYTSPPITIPEGTKATPVAIPALTPLTGGDGAPQPPPGRSSNRRIYGIVSGALGVAAITASALWARSEQGAVEDACDEEPPLCADGYSGKAADHYDRLRYGATAVFAVGLAAVGVGAYLFFTAPPGDADERATATRLVPTVTPDGGGVTILGRF
jgi:hypothetical protein